MAEQQETLGTKEPFESQGLHPTEAVLFVFLWFGLVFQASYPLIFLSLRSQSLPACSHLLRTPPRAAISGK